jgi:hypothetical protein
MPFISIYLSPVPWVEKLSFAPRSGPFRKPSHLLANFRTRTVKQGPAIADGGRPKGDIRAHLVTFTCIVVLWHSWSDSNIKVLASFPLVTRPICMCRWTQGCKIYVDINFVLCNIYRVSGKWRFQIFSTVCLSCRSFWALKNATETLPLKRQH